MVTALGMLLLKTTLITLIDLLLIAMGLVAIIVMAVFIVSDLNARLTHERPVKAALRPN
ncbi:hypothetical protein V8E54_004816 [Elaphomyces granulatus]